MKGVRLKKRILIGLTVGIGVFVVLLYFLIISPPVMLSLAEWGSETDPGDFDLKIISEDEIEKYKPIREGIASLERQKEIGVIDTVPYETVLPPWEASGLREELPFTEQSHPDQNFRAYYTILQVNGERYIIGLYYVRFF